MTPIGMYICLILVNTNSTVRNNTLLMPSKYNIRDIITPVIL